MELSQQLFSLEYSSSEEESEAPPCRFNIQDLPQLHIPSPFQSDSSGCESPTSPGSNLSSRPETPATPLSPSSSLGGVFSFIEISSQTSDGASGNPKPPRGKRYVKRKSGGYKKGQDRPPRSCPISDSPHMKRKKVERPKTPLFSGTRFPVPVGTYNIKTVSGGKETTREFLIPTGNAICNMEILSLVFAQLNCIDRLCVGRLKLYESLLQDGLQHFIEMYPLPQCSCRISRYSPYWCLRCGQYQQ